jgi:hypothetical protein
LDLEDERGQGQMKKFYPVEDKTLDRGISIALAQKRFIHSPLREMLLERGLYDDLNQTPVLAGLEAYRIGYDPDKDVRLIRNLAYRQLYFFLRSNGFIRQWDPITKRQGKGFFFREVCLPEDYKLEDPTSMIVDAIDFLAWCEKVVTEHLGSKVWQEVIGWARSRQPEPRGRVKEAISIIKGEIGRAHV